jgi:OmcA/MtrC family decaheme c-type cytochrome
MTDSIVRGSAQVAADKAAPAQGVNFNLLVHRIHFGENMKADGGSYTVVGFGGSHNDFSDIRFAPMSPNGTPGDTRNCSLCHVKGSEQNLPIGLNNVTTPQGFISPAGAVYAACSGCHVTKSAAAHALANSNSLGESCDVCHGSGADFSIGKVHAQ